MSDEKVKTISSGKFTPADLSPGVVAKKVGMTSYFEQNGLVTPVTVLEVLPAFVIDKKSKSSHGYDAVVVGYGDIKDKKLKKPAGGYFKKLGVKAFKKVAEFRVGQDYNQDLSVLDVSLFNEGQFVDVSGVSIGKGFAGVMKRHNFRGLEASHGVSISHRSHGSTGQRQDPGKVFKGKKMAGHMGCDNVTLQNLKIVAIDSENSLLMIKGSVPGFKGGELVITNARKKLNIS